MNKTVILSVMGRKGGVGKTTVAINLAAALALAGKSVLIVESDGQGNASQSVGIEPRDDFHSLIVQDADFADVIREVPDRFAGKAVNLSILSASDAQREVEEYKDTPQAMYDRFQELRGFYDYVIGDTSPGITEVHTGWYYASDYVLIPTLCEPRSVDSVAKTIEFLGQADKRGRDAGFPAAKVLGILPNRYSKGIKESQFHLGLLHGRYGHEHHIFQHLRDMAAWSTANREAQSIYGLTPERFDRRLGMSLKDARKEFQRIVDAVLALTTQEVTA